MGCATSSFETSEDEPQDVSKVTVYAGLEAWHPFSFEQIILHLKATPDVTVNGVQYGLLHTGGFVRIATDICRVYYLAQNTHGHTTPDWKFHVSVCLEDLPTAWNLLAKLFLNSGCRSGMKMCLRDSEDHFSHWSTGQYGREITIYIYKHCKIYKTMIVDDSALALLRKHEHTQAFWLSLAGQIDAILTSHNIRSHGLAVGDFPINKYVSIRNEAFVSVNQEMMYPPNECGWNATNHKCPIKVKHGTEMTESQANERPSSAL